MRPVGALQTAPTMATTETRPPEPREEPSARNLIAQLSHGMLGQTGFRLIGAPTFLPAYLFLLTQSDLFVGLARSLQAVGTVITPLVGAALIGHRSKILGPTLASSGLMRLSILGVAVVGFLTGADGVSWAAGWAAVFFLTVMGIFQGVSQVTMNALRAKVIPLHRRGIVGGARNFLAGMTSAGVSYLAGAYFIEQDVLGNGYASVFLFAFVIATLGLLTLAITDEPKATDLRPRASIRQTYRDVAPLLREDEPFRRFFIARSLGSFGRMAMPFYILFAGTVMELTGTLLGVVTTVWMLTSSTTNLFWGYIADRSGYKIVMATTLAIWAVAHGALFSIETSTGLIVFFVLMGMASGGFNQAGQNMVLEFGKAADIPIRLAASGSAVNLIGAIGPLLGGVIVAAAGYMPLFVVTIATQLIALALIIGWVPEPRRP